MSNLSNKHEQNIKTEKLRQQRAISIFTHSPNAIIIVDHFTGKVIDANIKAHQLFGYERNELIGNYTIHLFGNKNKSGLSYSSWEKMLPLINRPVEVLANNLKGKQIPISFFIGEPFAIENDMLNPVYIKELTKEKEEKNRNDNIQEILNKAQSIAHIGSIEIDLETGTRIWSDEFYRILGYEPLEVSADKEVFISLIHPSDQDKYRNWYNHAITHVAESDPIEIRMIRKDASVRNLLVNGRSYINEAGKLSKHIGIVLDVTEKNHLQEELSDSFFQLGKLTQHIPIAIFRMSVVEHGFHKIQFINKSIELIFPGILVQDVLLDASVLFSLVHQDDKQTITGYFSGNIELETVVNFEFRIFNKEGNIEWIKLYFHTELDEEKKKSCYGYFEVITNQKQNLLALEKQNETLRNIAWTQSHVVRAPLSRLMGVIDLFQKNLVREEEEQYFLNVIQESAKEIDLIISDINNKARQ